VKANDGAIGYSELVYALGNNLTFGAVRNRDGRYVKANLAAVTAAANSTAMPEDLCYSLADSPGSDSYPICGSTWAVLYLNHPAEKRQAIPDFLYWATHEGQQHCEALHYARLPPSLVKRIDGKLQQLRAALVLH
jgi:ABC-type phosphate transport system substrate-binding protein